MGYYPGWVQARLPAGEVEWSALSHVAHFSILPLPDGGIDTVTHELTRARSEEVIREARAAGVKVLLTVGSASTREAFLGATHEANRARFIRNLVDHVRANGYDGLDVDWEPIHEVDFEQYGAFIQELATALGTLSPRPLLTAAVLQSSALAPLFRELQEHFDMVNLMTYDLSGPWDGWVSWHNSPLYNGGQLFPGGGGELPSADLLVREFVAAGMDRRTLGIGIAFYGQEWEGVHSPGQRWVVPPTVRPVDYWQILESRYSAPAYRWDDVAKVPYLSFSSADPGQVLFVSYEDERSVTEKVRYARGEEIGGLIVWELGGGYLPDRPAGQRNPLLTALRNAYERTP